MSEATDSVVPQGTHDMSTATFLEAASPAASPAAAPAADATPAGIRIDGTSLR